MDVERGLPTRSRSGITYEHPGAFWFGVAAVTVGVLMHLPMYFSARHEHYVLAGKSPDAMMWLGMALILVGLVSTAYGLFPRLSEVSRGYVSRIKIRAMDEAPIKPAHVGLLLVMAAAITTDVMKPTTLAFIAPGAAAEYGLKSPLNPTAHGLPIALYPLFGISGTVVGSFLWGWFGDKIGRRASILLGPWWSRATTPCSRWSGT
jgi:MFS transporter, putative metabolite:H+ symporter